MNFMKSVQGEKLNYKIRLFNSAGEKIDEFEFHGDNIILAADHAQHVLNCDKVATIAHYKYIHAVNWKILYKNTIK